MDNKALLESLLYAEDENRVLDLLRAAGYSTDDDSVWTPLGRNSGNFSVVGNQQDNAAAAFVEKIINSIDAVLMSECRRHGVDPESSSAPSSMPEAVERFFDVHGGRLDGLSPTQQTTLASRINVIATGDRQSPCYCVVDQGEGQTPDDFPKTFLSTTQSSPKIRIDFVQGKFNAGGSGSLQFCGRHNIQLIVSRRQPHAIAEPDKSADLWGFTIILRRRPRAGERSSVFVYLAPNESVLRFHSETLKVLPGQSSKNTPPKAYTQDLQYGTAVKLYNYQWTGRGIATLEARRNLEKALHIPCLPFRITETRGYRAHSYATSIVGVWNKAGSQKGLDSSYDHMESGFPATATVSLRNVGSLPIRIGVWSRDLNARNHPTGVYFLVNGQVHGQYGSEFVSRRLGLDYIQKYILVSVDCTSIDRSVAEDLFMASRDRLRRNQHYDEIREVLANELGSHQGLKELNAARRKERTELATEGSPAIASMVSHLIRSDPGLANLFGDGARIVTSVGPGIGLPFGGRQFPTYFRISKKPKQGTLLKRCPVNRTVKVEFETDAENGYFDRAEDPGAIQVEPGVDLIEASSLWNGRFVCRFRVPWDAVPGDITHVRVMVSDVERIATGPFVSEFDLTADPAIDSNATKLESTTNPRPSSKYAINGNKLNPSLDLPKPHEVRKEQWGDDIGINGPYDAFRVKSGADGGYDFFVNVDCAWLLTELAAKTNDPAKVKHWFVWGLTLAALGIIHKLSRATRDEGNKGTNPADGGPDLGDVGRACDGLAQVIIPMFRVLFDGPPE